MIIIDDSSYHTNVDRRSLAAVYVLILIAENKESIRLRLRMDLNDERARFD